MAAADTTRPSVSGLARLSRSRPPASELDEQSSMSEMRVQEILKDAGLPCFIDFEASSLSAESYPIEVAWNLEDGAIERHLISPEGVGEWDDWSDASAKVHGISYDDLKKHGKAPAWVVNRLNEALDGKTVHSDAPRFDSFWLYRLFEAAGAPAQSFKIGDAESLLRDLIYQQTDEPAVLYSHLARLRSEARRKCPRQHRAAWDVEYWIELFKLARDL